MARQNGPQSFRFISCCFMAHPIDNHFFNVLLFWIPLGKLIMCSSEKCTSYFASSKITFDRERITHESILLPGEQFGNMLIVPIRNCLCSSISNMNYRKILAENNCGDIFFSRKRQNARKFLTIL